jgi:hypothetical protein
VPRRFASLKHTKANVPPPSVLLDIRLQRSDSARIAACIIGWRINLLGECVPGPKHKIDQRVAHQHDNRARWSRSKAPTLQRPQGGRRWWVRPSRGGPCMPPCLLGTILPLTLHHSLSAVVPSVWEAQHRRIITCVVSMCVRQNDGLGELGNLAMGSEIHRVVFFLQPAGWLSMCAGVWVGGEICHPLRHGYPRYSRIYRVTSNTIGRPHSWRTAVPKVTSSSPFPLA